MNSSINATPNQMFCISEPIPEDNWSLIIEHNLTVAYDITEISYNL